MRKLLAYIRLSIIDAFEYRGDMLIFSLSWAAQPLVFLIIWLTISSQSTRLPLTRDEFVTYYALLFIVQIWVSAWGAPFIARSIRLGKLSPFLVKPSPYVYSQVAENIGEKIIKTSFTFPIMLAIIYFFHPHLPSLSLFQTLLFLIAWVFAGIIFFLLDLTIGFLAFWLEEVQAIRQLYFVLFDLTSGQIVPLFVLPIFLREIANFLPFRYALSFPLEIFLNKLSTEQILTGFLFSLFWIITLIFVNKKVWEKGIKKYSAYGA